MKKVRLKGRKIKHVLCVVIILCLIVAEFFTLKHIADRTRPTEIESVNLGPVSIGPEIKTAVQKCVANISPARTHDVAETVDISQEDAELLLKVAMAEGGCEGEDGQWLILSVILNRVESDEFPDTIREVIYQDHQFSTVTNGSIYKVEPTSETHYALARVESGDIAQQIVAFETTDSTTLDAYFLPAFTYRHHQFYTEKH